MLNGPFSPWPSFSEEEAVAINNVLMSNKVNYWTGHEGREFESEFAEFVGVEYAIALANGSVALDVALHSLGVTDGDEVIVTSRTFIASASSIVLAGATPVFADVDIDSQNITPDSISSMITAKTKAIICVHLAGWPCDMDEIMKVAKANRLYVVEDCAQAHGALYKGVSVGSIGDVGCWSFCQDKIMSTGGEGGMVTTNNKALWSSMWAYKDHGKSWNAVYEKEHPHGFRWLHESFGTNYRMTEMQAAIGRIQLKRMGLWHKKRQYNAKRIWAFAGALKGIRVPDLPSHIEHAAYKCYVFVEPSLLSEDWSRDKIVEEINGLGVPCFTGSCSEVYREKAFVNKKISSSLPLKAAKELGDTSLMFLVHPTISNLELKKTCDVLKQVMEKAVF